MVPSSRCRIHLRALALHLFRRPPALPYHWMRYSSGTAASSTQEDDALQWARSNPTVAQACLNVPPSSQSSVSSVTKRFTGKTWLEFYEWRMWDFPRSMTSKERDYGRALVTHVMTGPLTLSAASRTLFPSTLPTECLIEENPDKTNGNNTHAKNINDSNNDIRRVAARQIRWCCLGARSEASLPLEYWAELLRLLVGQEENDFADQRLDPTIYEKKGLAPSFHLMIDFIGPEMDSTRSDATLTQNSSSLTLRWVFTGKFHDYCSLCSNSLLISRSYDAYILFNPGVGHPFLRKDWRPTLDLLFAFRESEHPLFRNARSPFELDDDTLGIAGAARTKHCKRPAILLTAHSMEDAARDCAFLRQSFNLPMLTYELNPFASQIRYQDPLKHGHLVQPNHYVTIVTGNERFLDRESRH